MSARKFKLRCSKCYKADSDNYDIDRIMGKMPGKTWQAVDAIKRTENGVLCKCRRCGHEYISSASAAYRKLDKDEF